MTKILIPVEDREFGKAQLEFLIEHQIPAQSEIILLTLVRVFALQEYGYNSPRAYFDLLVQEDERLAKMLHKELEEQIREKLPDAKFCSLIEFGAPVPEILREAKERHIDWIIMGSHGRSGFDKFFLGSVSQGVVNRAPCSVSIVRLPEAKEHAAKEQASQIQESRETNQKQTQTCLQK